MNPDEITRRLILAVYEQGWFDAQRDHMEQAQDPRHPIGTSKRCTVDQMLGDIDPSNLLGLV